MDVDSKAKRARTTGPTILFVKRFSPKLCASHSHIRFVFGDNLEDYTAQSLGKKARGYKGQAAIRDCDNAFGVPTKEKAARTLEAYWKDDAFDHHKEIIDLAFDRLLDGDPLFIAFPADGLGTGLAQLDRRAPRTFTYLVQRIRDLAADSMTCVSPGGWFNSQPEFVQMAARAKKRLIEDVAQKLGKRLVKVYAGQWIPIKRFLPPAGGPSMQELEASMHTIVHIVDGHISSHGPNVRGFHDVRSDGIYFSWGYAR